MSTIDISLEDALNLVGYGTLETRLNRVRQCSSGAYTSYGDSVINRKTIRFTQRDSSYFFCSDGHLTNVRLYFYTRYGIKLRRSDVLVNVSLRGTELVPIKSVTVRVPLQNLSMAAPRYLNW